MSRLAALTDHLSLSLRPSSASLYTTLAPQELRQSNDIFWTSLAPGNASGSLTAGGKVEDDGDGLRRAEDAQHMSWRGQRGTVWLYAGTEDVADDGEHGYRRAERTYAPWQGRRDAIWLYAGTEDVAGIDIGM